MARFMVKVLLLICTLLFGILLGIQQAEHGILSVLGTPSFNAASGQAAQEAKESEEQTDESKAEEEDKEPEVYIKRIDGEEVEVGVVGEHFSIQDLEEKQEKWEDLHHHNRYSKLGTKLGNLVYSLSRKGAESFARLLDKVF
ncbi:hypothetical protein J2S00_002395 [Caldalkalibacillus uzonensis]|uniref:DUF3679 domain-containing protein n=1 Tax=Caldalkalibacillus uzonensis TaxID=353224 RepID=A0ABU0CT60_9BACI|nr:DUF3679 domain-containing protein [Caldalkalibacillus uzonensis]MDQ0339607.1 hypothetical protein [Caldalkalibacillus uzonensis]